MGDCWEWRSGTWATACLVPRAVPTSRALSVHEASGRNTGSKYLSQVTEGREQVPRLCPVLSPPKGPFSSIQAILHQQHHRLRSTSSHSCPLPVCASPPPHKVILFPLEASPTKVGSAASANFVLMELNRCYLPFMLPFFSQGKRK